MPCGVGPSTSETVASNSSKGLEHIDDTPSLPSLLAALSVPPVDFHAQHFAKSSEELDGHGSDVWTFFWPVESKEPTPLKDDEPILTQRPKSSAIACRPCWNNETWKVYKLGGGIMSTLRNHLETRHKTLYEGYQRTNAWEMEQRKHKEGHTKEPRPFQLAGFLEHLIRWIVSDDQASNLLISSFYYTI